MSETYVNPVAPAPCTDPFVLEDRGVYWAYCTGTSTDGRLFRLQRSVDLVHWTDAGGAMIASRDVSPCCSDPHVVVRNGRYFLYYSSGDASSMTIRVATADAPQGPFVDSGHRLTEAAFARDPHVFEDADGQWWMIYVTLFTTDQPQGSATVCDRMRDAFTLNGHPALVTRAASDWHVHDAAAPPFAAASWHVIEAPFVLRHKGLYYQMFSGGDRLGANGGIGYATSITVNAIRPWLQRCDGIRESPLLRGVRAGGAGRTTAVRGPDGQQMYCVYPVAVAGSEAPGMALDRLDWTGERLIILGPSSSPQPIPTPATVHLFDDTTRWTLDGGDWQRGADTLRQRAVADGCARTPLPAVSCVSSLWLRANMRTPDPLRTQQESSRMTTSTANAAVSLRLDDGAAGLEMRLMPHARRAETRLDGRIDRVALPDVDLSTPHAVRLQVDERRVSVSLDGRLLWLGRLPQAPTHLCLATHGCAAEFEAGRSTVGWEETFSPVEGDGVLDAWHIDEGNAGCWLVDHSLLRRVAGTPSSRLLRRAASCHHELVVNLRARHPRDGSWRVIAAEGSASFTLVTRADGWGLKCDDDVVLPLPAFFDPTAFHQLRLRRTRAHVTVTLDGQCVGTRPLAPQAARVGLEADADDVQVDLVRFTALSHEAQDLNHLHSMR